MVRLFTPALLLLWFCRPALAATSSDKTALPPSTLVTLHLKDKPLSEALASISTQTGWTFDHNNPRPRDGFPDPAISIDCDRTPFWEAMAQLSRSGGISPLEHAGGHVTLFPDQGVWGRRPAVLLGAIRVCAVEFQSNRVIALGRTSKQTATSNLSIAIEPEPGLTAISVDQLTLESATDQDGHPIPITPAARGRSGINTFYRGRAHIQIPIDPGPMTQRLATVKGSAQVLIAPQTKLIEIAGILQAGEVKQQFGDITVHISFKRLPNQYSVQVVLDYEGDDEAFGKRLNMAIQSSGAQLLDAAGVPYPEGGSQGGPHGRLGASRTLFFPLHPRRQPVPGPPDKFKCVIPTSFQLLPISFEFHDLDLP